MRHLFLLGGCGVAALLSLNAAAASAQSTAGVATQDGGQVDDIVVTAQRREQNVQDVPIALTAFNAQALQDRGVNNVADLNNLAPSLRITNGEVGANPRIFIRGVGHADINSSSSSGVSMYVDGVYVGPGIAQLASFYDLDRAEVLRGPQGTLFGRNTTGGAISVTTKGPTNEFSADGSLEYGTFNSVNVVAGVGGPIVKDVLAVRVAAQHVRDDGTIYNRVTGNRVNDANRTAVRLALRFTPTGDIDITGRIEHFVNRSGVRQGNQRPLIPRSPVAAGPDGLCLPSYYSSGLCTDALGYADTDNDPYAVDSNVEGIDRVDVTTASLDANWHFSDVSLTAITGYIDAKRKKAGNPDGSPMQLFEDLFRTNQQQFTQELRLQSTGQGPAQWLVGFFYLNDDLADNSQWDVLRALRPLYISPSNPTGANIASSVATVSWPYTQKTEGFALFGQADIRLGERLTVTGGLRWSSDKKTFDYRATAENQPIVSLAYSDEKTFRNLSGRASVQYDVDDNVHAYASYNRGFKSGGFFGARVTDVSQLEPYRNENIDAFEIGMKTDLLNRRLRFNLAGFLYKYNDQQVYAVTNRGGLNVQIFENAASSTLYGVEAEVVARPTNALNIDLGLAWLKAEYGDYVSGTDDFSGNKMPHAPEFTANGRASYTIDLAGGSSIVPAVDANFRTKIYYSSINLDRLSDPSLLLVNAQLSWRSASRQVEAGLWARNLTDKVYTISVPNTESLGFDLVSYGLQRTVGVFGRLHF